MTGGIAHVAIFDRAILNPIPEITQNAFLRLASICRWMVMGDVPARGIEKSHRDIIWAARGIVLEIP